MAIDIKDKTAIEKMRIAGKLASSVLDMITSYVKPDTSTLELNNICHKYIIDYDAIPAPLNYHGFPKSICTSVNHVVCHGIPNEKKLKNGDIINIDVTVIKDGYHGDTSRMYFVGDVPIKAQKLVKVAKQCLEIAIDMVKPGIRLGKIGAEIEKHAHSNNYSVVRDYCGHGIGRNFHELPQVLHFDDGNIENTILLQEGMTFTIEPMINIGLADVKLSKHDGWTVTTRDRSLSAQWEHTLLVTNTGVEILTK